MKSKAVETDVRSASGIDIAEWTPVGNGSVTSPAGYAAAAVHCGLKKNEALDLAIVYTEQASSCAAVFTKNQVVAAPVIVDRETLAADNGHVRAIVANAGNANACTGEVGLANAREMQRIAAEQLTCKPEQVLVLSTGVIGVHLPMEKLRSGIVAGARTLSAEGGRTAAEAIMTTDTRPKRMAVKVKLFGGSVVIGGMAKGAGMIHPNMATMLAVITTDAVVTPAALDDFLRTAVNASFNRISIDGDTSTNDAVLLLANGSTDVTIASAEDSVAFSGALTHVCTELAQMIVRDGEGATKFVEIQVTGCGDESQAHAIAQSIATSPLVKTAFAGSDANWGRILAAAGRAGIPFDQNRVNLWVGAEGTADLQLVAEGTPTAYQEADATAIFAESELSVRLDVGMGHASATMWTSDLTQEYVSINADYRS